MNLKLNTCLNVLRSDHWVQVFSKGMLAPGVLGIHATRCTAESHSVKSFPGKLSEVCEGHFHRTYKAFLRVRLVMQISLDSNSYQYGIFSVL